MRYGLIPETPLEEQLLWSPRAPRAIYDTFLPLLQAQAIMAAVRLRIFESLRDGGRSANEIARELNLHPESLDLVLRVLAASGYVMVEDSRYQLTEVARQTLLDGSEAPLMSFVGLNEISWEWIGRLNNLVRTGCGIDMHQNLGDAQNWATYQGAMLETSRRTAPLVAPPVPVRPGSRKLLDVAGSHGLFGAHICRTNPPMRSVVLDLPEAVEPSRKLARKEGIDDVVSHRAGNALIDDLDAPQDVVFLGNILHHFSPQQCKDLFARIQRTLNQDGTVAVWEVRKPEPSEPPDIVGDGFALHFRITSTARCYTTKEYTGWLAETGFTDVLVHPTPFAPFQVLISGRAR
jgi:DNA-binding transcriptional ArsR family regulator